MNIVDEDLEFIVGQNYIPWKELEGKNILISGPYGFISSYLVKLILYLNEHQFSKKASVYGIARKHRNNVFEKRNNLYIFEQNVCDPIKAYLPKMDHVIHAASKTGPKYYKSDLLNTVLPNVIGTYNLLELVKNWGIKSFLFFSSGAIYSNFDTLDIRSSYAESKRMGENLCISYLYQYNIPIKIARIFHTYGPGMDLNNGNMISDFISDILNKRDTALKSQGKEVRTLSYISDTISALYAILLKGKIGSAYDVGNNEQQISVFDLARLMCNLYPELHLTPGFVPDDNSTVQRGVKAEIPNTSDLRSLGWKPKYLLESGIYRTIESYK